ncbi:MAG: gliding motility-associated C-terminal domain-containing protein, partial [Bacteroidota bacterium]
VMKKLVLLLKFKLALLFLLGVFSTSQSYASHASAAEISYRHISGNTFEFTVVYYNNCLPGAAGSPGTMILRYESASLNITRRTATTLTKLPTFGVGVPAVRPLNLLNCTNATLCFDEFVYRGQFTVPGRAIDWIFSCSVTFRPPELDNITQNGFGEYDIWAQTRMNNLDFPDNSSPIFHDRWPQTPGFTLDTFVNYPFRTLCEQNFYTFDLHAIDRDGDSITYELYHIQGNNGINVNYVAPWTPQQPITTIPANSFAIDPNTGIIPFVPGPPAGPVNTSFGEVVNTFIVGVQATEYAPKIETVNGRLVQVWKEASYVRRDMMVVIDGPTTCKRDFIHPYPDRVDCGDSTIRVRFRSAPNDWSRVRCATISADGSEFRVMDSTANPPRSIAVLGARWVCGFGDNTSYIDIDLEERLHWDNDYYVLLKAGTDLDVLESECGFLEPEFSDSKIRFKGNTPVDLALPPAISVCLPQENPFPQLEDTFKVADQYFWTFNGDTIPGQDIDKLWAQEAGTYQVLVKGPWGCPGNDQVDVYFPTSPTFDFDLPAYCDTTRGEDPSNLPALLTLPNTPTTPVGGSWHWEYNFGPPNGFDLVKTGDSLITIGDGTYALIYTDTNVGPGIPGCVTRFEFDFNRETHPPEQPLTVKIEGDPILCEVGDGNTTFWLNSSKFKPNFQPKSPNFEINTPYTYQWYEGNFDNPITGAFDSSIVRSKVGTYLVQVRDAMGCVGFDSIRIERIGKPPAFPVFCNVLGGKRGRFSWAPVELATSYEVSADDGLTWVNTENNFFDVDDIRVVGKVWVKANIDNVCKESFAGESEPCAADVFPPNIITPNQDGLNDVFFVGSLDLFPESGITIFDRWGTVVFESNDYQHDWDGDDAPEGTYYYVINVNDPAASVYKGVLTLLR